MILWGSQVKHRRRHRKIVPLQQRVLRPLEGRFALPNQIWEFGLKQTDFVILTYLYYWQAHAQEISNLPTTKEIAAHVGVQERSVKQHLAELVGRGLVTSEISPSPVFPVQSSGHFFSLPDEVFTRLDLPHSALMVYALLLCYENRRTHSCHPSYRTISAATGLAVNTVMKHIGILADKDLIRVDHSSYYDERGMKWTGNNKYTFRAMSVVFDARKLEWVRRIELEEEQRRLKLRRRRYSAETVCAEAEDEDEHEPLPF